MPEMFTFGILVQSIFICMSIADLVPQYTEKLTQQTVSGEKEICTKNPDFYLDPALRIGAWNVQRLGKRKVGNATIANYVAQVISRYDVIVLEEVVDSSQKAIYELLTIVTEVAYTTSDNYDAINHTTPAPAIYNVTVSDRVGQTSYKEQYAFFYRKDVVSVRDSTQYPDIANDFKYPPFIVTFNTPTLKLDWITFVSIHVSPSVAPYEIDSLIKVGDYIKEELQMNDIVFLGDFNAGCTYVTNKDWETLRFFLDERFTWIISNHIDTTTKYTSCPYDRIVITGQNLTDIVYEKSAKAFHFDDQLNITDEDLVESISDHFPVETLLRGKVQTSLNLSLSILTGPTYPSISELDSYLNYCQDIQELENDIVDIFFDCLTVKNSSSRPSLQNRLYTSFYTYGNEYINRTAGELNEMNCHYGEELDRKHAALQYSLTKCGTRPLFLTKAGPLQKMSVITKDLQYMLNLLETLTSIESCIFTNEATTLLRHKLESGTLKDPSVFMEDIPEWKMLQLLCVQNHCYIIVSTQVPVM